MPNIKLDTPVQYLKGVGPKVAALFGKLGVSTVQDLIYLFPRSYEDRSVIKPIGALKPSEPACPAGGYEIIKGEITLINHQITRNRFSVLKAIISDRSGSVQAVWFNQPYLQTLLRRGMRVIVSGKVEYSDYERVLQLSVRDFEIDTGENLKIVPQYPLTEGLYPKKVRSLVKLAIDDCLDMLEDPLPDSIRKKHRLYKLKEAILGLHFPSELSKVEPARRRLAFDELFVFQIGIGLFRQKVESDPGIAFKIDPGKLAAFKTSLPFTLTGAQERVLAEIFSDMEKTRPMNRLLQGDVGSGKTVIAAIAAFIAVKNGYQAALMAPTEILAQQHYTKLVKLFEKEKIGVELLTGTTQRKLKAESGTRNTGIYVGTHALLEEKVGFRKLGLVIIDEQHRFGVMQRAQLVKKGFSPDVLVMTATPIPRSLALTLYGELDRSVIDELPPGRTPIKTYYVPENKRSGTYQFLRQKIKEGRQVFVICPLVSESEKIDLKAAMDEATRLQEEIFPEFKVGLLHGRLKGEEKDKIMRQFAAGKIHILVSTTVIEVGIDIPNATVMVIEHAERFGLSQLHQLRGRIGRGGEQSHCFLLAETKTPEAKARIKAMLDSTDGFYIAEVDLQIRGPGDFCGTRQSGLPNFRVADIIRDEKTLKEARAAAFGLITEDINSARHIWESQREKIKGAFTGETFN